jgi:hypothetical protein
MHFTFAGAPVAPTAEGVATCSCLSKIQPRKLVCHMSYWRYGPNKFLPFCPDLKTAVIRYLSLWEGDIEPVFSGQNIDHLVVIGLARPANDRSSSWHPFMWDRFCSSILDTAQIADCPTSITIVHMESIDSDYQGGCFCVKWLTEVFQKDYLESIPTFAGTPGKKTAEQAQQVKIKFVSMATYLAEYDWRGEMTEEEVTPWSDAVRKIRAGGTNGEDEV